MTDQEQQVSSGLQIQEDASAGNRRRLKNYLIKPLHQLKYAYYLISVGFAIFGTTMWLVQLKLAQIDILLRDNQIVDAFVQNQIQDAYSDITKTTLAGFAGYVAFTFIYSMLVSHRVSGPIIAILAFVDELKKGNYAYKRDLRHRDELGPIMKGLQELADVLRSGRSKNP